MLTLLLIALSAFVLTEAAKAVLPVVLQSWTKLLIAVGVAVMTCIGLDLEPENIVYWATAGAGLAALIHKLHRLLSALGDAQQVSVMVKSSARRGPLLP